MLVSLNDDNTIKSVEGQDTDFTEDENSWTGKGTWVKFYSEDEANGWCFKEGVTYYVAIAPANFTKGVAVNFILADDSKVEGVKKTENPVNLKPNTILDLGELEYTAPVVHDWTIAGTFNGWNATANPMTLEGDCYVAKNITGLDQTFKFIQKGVTWRGGEGKVTAGTWAYIWGNDGSDLYVDGASDETAYDVYLNPNEGDYGKFVVVPAGTPMPDDTPVEEPEVVVGYWAVVGTMSNWEDYATMELDGDWYVATDVKLTVSDQFKFRADNNWDVNRGAAGEVDGVVIENDVETDVYANGKNFAVAEGGFYTVSINKAATKAKVVKTADLPVSSVPDQPCDWALWAESPDWKQIDMVTTTVPDLFVAKSVTLDAYKSFLVKPAADWSTKYGTGNVNYIKANKWFTASQNGGDITVEVAGTYDIYFDYSTKKVYLMTSGTSYTSAAEQTVSGEEPVVEEPEVTANVLYLAFNGVWKNNDERYAAYFFNSSGNKWVSMTDSDSDGIYEVNIPTGYSFGDSVIFCRMNGSTTANNWTNKWNQTADLTIPTDGKNLYTVTAWDNSGNSNWSKK